MTVNMQYSEIISVYTYKCTGPSSKTNAIVKFKLHCDKQRLEVPEMSLIHNHENRPMSISSPSSIKKIR